MSAVNTVSSVGNIAAAASVIPVLAIVFVGCRLHLRIKKRREKRHEKRLGFEDYVQPVSLTLFIGICITAWIGIANRAVGYAAQGPSVPPPPELSLSQKLVVARQYMELVASGLTKLSAIWLYRRLFSVCGRSAFDYVSLSTAALVICWMVAFIFFFLFRCGAQVSAAWTGGAPNIARFCGGVEHSRMLYFQVAYPVSALVLDTIVLALPVRPIWKLQLSPRSKVGITLIFMTALVGYGAAITRVVIAQEARRRVLEQKEKVDLMILNSALFWFSIVEVGLSLIAVNAPIVWQVVPLATGKLHSLGSLIGSRMSSKTSLARRNASADTGRAGLKAPEKNVV